MTKVYTDIRTLSKVKRLLNELGVLQASDVERPNFNIFGLLDKLLDEGKFAEFMQIITKDETTDWEDKNMPELKEIISNFFGDMMVLLPESVKTALTTVIIPSNHQPAE